MGETEKTRETLIKGLAATIFIVDGKKNRDRQKVRGDGWSPLSTSLLTSCINNAKFIMLPSSKVMQVMEAEVVNYRKITEKLRTKNRVIKDQKDKIFQKIKINLSTSEVLIAYNSYKNILPRFCAPVSIMFL